jgi:hypothetical protein
MDFLAPIVVIALAVLAIYVFAKRNKGTRHAGDLRPDRRETSIIADEDGRAAHLRSEDRGRAS